LENDMKKNYPELRPEEPLSLLIESAKHETPKDAICCLKRARRAIKREIRQIRKHLKRFPMPARHSKTPKQTSSRPVHVVNARLGAIAAANQTPSGFCFSPPDPAVVRELLIADSPCEAGGATEDVPEPEAVGGGDVLILADRESSPRS